MAERVPPFMASGMSDQRPFPKHFRHIAHRSEKRPAKGQLHSGSLTGSFSVFTSPQAAYDSLVGATRASASLAKLGPVIVDKKTALTKCANYVDRYAAQF